MQKNIHPLAGGWMFFISRLGTMEIMSFLEAFYEGAVLLVVGVELKVFVEIYLGVRHVFLIEVVVAHVVVHDFGVGSVARRILAGFDEILGKVRGVTIADDYAHHPKELEVTLKAASQMGFGQVWAVFQPFTYSRTSLLFDDFVRVLQIPDHTVLSEIMGSREVNTYNIYARDLAEKIPGCVWFPGFEEIAAYVMERARPGDLVITLGCGDIYKCARMMLKQAGEEMPAP